MVVSVPALVGTAGATTYQTVNGWTGTTGSNGTATTTLSNGDTVTITVTGNETVYATSGESLTTRAGSSAASYFDSNVNVSSNAIALATGCPSGNANCSTSPTNANTPSVGSFTITFSKPVVNPVINISGLGGTLGTTHNGTLYEGHIYSDYTITNPGMTLSLLGNGTNNPLVLSNNNTTFTDSNAHTSSNCTSSSYGGYAGCGSVQVIGTGTSFTFTTGFDVELP